MKMFKTVHNAESGFGDILQWYSDKNTFFMPITRKKDPLEGKPWHSRILFIDSGPRFQNTHEKKEDIQKKITINL